MFQAFLLRNAKLTISAMDCLRSGMAKNVSPIGIAMLVSFLKSLIFFDFFFDFDSCEDDLELKFECFESIKGWYFAVPPKNPEYLCSLVWDK